MLLPTTRTAWTRPSKARKQATAARPPRQSSTGPETKMTPLARPVGAESSPIKREDVVSSSLFGEGDERRVRVVHGNVRVLVHQGATARQAPAGRRNEEGPATNEELQAGLLTPADSPQQIHGFGQNRLRTQENPLEGFKESGAFLVVTVVTVQNGDQRSRI